MELRFVKSESAFDYFASTHAYLERHGKPVAFYSDKHSIFRVHHDGSTGRARGVTQFGRALTELNIDIICANSPQAKGRVERMNKTLQDRLVKELRLHGISTMEAGNGFLPEFMEDYNRRFGRAPKSAHDAHRQLRGDEDLSRIFTWQEERTMSRNLVVHFKAAGAGQGADLLKAQTCAKVKTNDPGAGKQAHPCAGLCWEMGVDGPCSSPNGGAWFCPRRRAQRSPARARLLREHLGPLVPRGRREGRRRSVGDRRGAGRSDRGDALRR
jgi:hypothetical protein